MLIDAKLIEVHIYRENCGIEYLLLKRSFNEIYPLLWQMVTGKIKHDEKAYTAALREVKEETNLDISDIWVVPNINSFYDWTEEYISLVPVFLVKADINQEVKISDEHSEFAWLRFEDAINRFAWPGQRKSLEIIDDFLVNEASAFQFNKIKI